MEVYGWENRGTKWRFIAGRLNETHLEKMKIVNTKPHQTKWVFFQQTMFDYGRNATVK